MKPVRIGFVGAGTMGQGAHLRNYATLPECEVVALAEIRPKLARRVATKYGITRLYESHEQMLTNESLDGLVASQPFARHGQILPDLLRAGLPVFAEKPLAGNIDVARQIVDAAHRYNTFVMVGYHKRCDPATVWAKQQIEALKESRTVGAMRYVRITMPKGDWVRNGFFDLIQSDEPVCQLPDDPPAADMDEQAWAHYLAFINFYIHQINLLRHLLAESYQLVFVDEADTLLVGRSQSGVTCTLEMSPYSSARAWEESILVAFEHGYVKLELPAPMALNTPGRAELYRDQADDNGQSGRFIPTLPWEHAMREQARRFLAAVRGEAPPPCDQDEALEDLHVARAYMQLRHAVAAPV
ncbi:MAG: Gfo/Idh/MocA family oxidoreductase [Phycisphaeraceae bacterium]